MSDLQTIKLELKQWERSFKASNRRDPRKEDIKQDLDIAEKYRVYNKSRKDNLSTGTGSASNIISSAAQPGIVTLASSTTTLNIPAPNFVSSPATPSKLKKQSSTDTTTSTYSTVTSKPTVTSPVRPSGRSQPKNPFLLSPTRPSSSDLSPDSSVAPRSKSSASVPPSVLYDADSLLTETAIGWTPRTKARKRLNGEIGGDTPKGKKRRGTDLRDGSREDEYEYQRDGRSKMRRKAGPLGNVREGDDENDEEDVVGPSPMKPQDQPRRALPVRHRQPTTSSASRIISDDEKDESTDAEEDYTDETDSDEPAGTSKSKSRLQGTPRSLFTRGKSVSSSSSTALGAVPTSSMPAPSVPSSRTRPFTFATTKAWDDRPPSGSTSQDPPTLSSILSPNSSAKKATQMKNSRGRSLSMTGEGKPPSKKVRAWSGKPKVASAFGAAVEARARKAEQTLKEMAGEDIDEEVIEDVGETGEKGDKEGVASDRVSSIVDGDERDAQEGIRIVRSHLLGVPKREPTSAAVPVPISRDRLFLRNQACNRTVTLTNKDGEVDDQHDENTSEAVAEVQVSDEGMWNSDLETDLQPSTLYRSPEKRRTSNRRLLYGLPNDAPSPSSSSSNSPGPQGFVPGSFNELDTGLDAYPSPYGIEPSSRSASSRAASRMINDDLPPHLLALLSLRSPEATSAKVARQRDETFKSIFAVPTHQAASVENELDQDVAGAELTRGPGGFKNGRGKGRQSRPNRWNGGLKNANGGKEATNGAGTGTEFMGPPQPPTGSVLTSDGGTWDRPKEKRKVKREVWGIGDTAEVQGIEDGSDDDWASEPEGWKETPGGMLEDEDW